MSNTRNNLFFSGIPTAPDVKKIEDSLGTPKEGDIVEWGMIEKIILCTRNTYRFSSVVTAWRKKLEREQNILMIAEPGKGLKAASPDERIDWSARKVRYGRRAIVRGSAVAASTDTARLSSACAETRAWICDVPARLRLAEQCAARPVKKPV